MKNTANLALIILSIFLISCNNNDDDTVTETEPVSENLIITSEIITVTLNLDNGESVFIYDTPISNNKRRNSTATTSNGTYPNKNYIYNTNDLLIGSNYENQDEYVFEYHYDDNNVLSEIVFQLNLNTINHYRIVNQGNNIYFHEWLTLAPSNTNTEIIRRIIIELDTNDNIIKAGLDLDKDGNYDSFRTFTYSSDQDLTQATDVDGQSYTFLYSNVKNTSVFIDRKVFGKRNLTLQSAEVFALISLESESLKKYSTHVPMQEIDQNNYTFELNENGYFMKRTSTEPYNNGTRTSELQYTF